MRIPWHLTLLAAVVTLAALIVLGAVALQPPRPLITSAAVADARITPNADGENDATTLCYSLSRQAAVSIYFESADGARYYFRRERARPRGEYAVLFSGVVEGYTRPGETVQGTVEARLLADGDYTWVIEATAPDGETQRAAGTLTVAEADAALPDLVEFTISPETFTPNQDGIADRAQINVYLAKDADLTVYLQGPDGVNLYVAERLEGREPGEAGRHLFDYEGGVDLGADPPPDGTYTVVAVAQDAEGQRVTRTGTLTLQQGGKPRAEIVAQPVGGSVVFETMPYDERYFSAAGAPGDLIPLPEGDPAFRSDVTVPLGDLLVFRLTVWNYSNVPIRTSGPPPGTVYQQDQRASTLGWIDESGAWRVGIDCDTAVSDYPWRWAVGAADELVAVERDGQTFHYLPPGEQAVVWGAIRLTEINAQRNPQNCWAGLIHEDVEIAPLNNNVDPRQIEIVDGSAAFDPSE